MFHIFYTKFENVQLVRIFNALRKIFPNLMSSERDSIDAIGSSKKLGTLSFLQTNSFLVFGKCGSLLVVKDI